MYGTTILCKQILQTKYEQLRGYERDTKRPVIPQNYILLFVFHRRSYSLEVKIHSLRSCIFTSRTVCLRKKRALPPAPASCVQLDRLLGFAVLQLILFCKIL